MWQPYLNPLLAAFLFAAASLSLKRGLQEGAGATRSVFITNTTFLVALLPLWWFFDTPVTTALLWAPAVAGLAAFVGSVAQFLALKAGDVSVATPLLGGKVLFVALFSTIILGNALPLSWWLGALLAGLGIFFLGRSPAGHSHPPTRLGYTILMSLGSVSSFALMDILIAGWAGEFGFQRFVVVQQVVVFACSLFLIPFFQGPLRQLPLRCWPWLLGGSLVIVVQFYILNWTISQYGNPTAVNILYSSRGLWSVLLVWSVGPLFGNLERGHGWGMFWRRGVGAGLLLLAISLVVLEPMNG